jgi:DNA-binding CsgD family transcriptional regulator
MNQNNSEIATISGISLRTVETQRYRLSKILNLKNDQDLNSYITNL